MEEKRSVGAPQKEIDFDQLDKLCALHCTKSECAAVLGVSTDTLLRRIQEAKGMSFKEYYQEKSSLGKVSIRRKQYESAMQGNWRALEFLGRNWLGQDSGATIEINSEKTEKLVILMNDDISLSSGRNSQAISGQTIDISTIDPSEDVSTTGVESVPRLRPLQGE